MRILIDMDEVIVDMIPKWLDLYNEDYDDSLSINDIHSWGIHSIVKPECGKKIYNYINKKGFFLNLKPKNGAIEYIDKLVADFHDVIIVTASPFSSAYAAKEKYEWVKKYLPRLAGYPPRIIMTHHKYMVSGDILFDDSPNNLIEYSKYNPRSFTVAKSAKYNAGAGNFRVSSWDVFYHLIGIIEEFYFSDEYPYIRRIS